MKGQVTIYLILGIVIILIGVLVLMIPKKGIDDDIPDEIREVKKYIEACLEMTAESGSDLVGLKGGYYTTPSHHTKGTPMKIPYYFASGRTIAPEKSVIEGEIARYMIDNIETCYNDFESFSHLDITIDASVYDVHLDDTIVVDMDADLTVVVEDQTQTVSDFSAQFPSELNRMYLMALDIAESHEINAVPLSKLNKIAKDNDIIYEIQTLSDTDVIITLINTEWSPKVFSFAAHYGEINLPEPMPDLNASIDFSTVIDLPISDDAIVTENSEIVEVVDRQLVIEPKSEHIGLHLVQLTIEQNGFQEKRLLRINVYGPNEPPYIEYIPDFYLDHGETFTFNVISSDSDSIYFLLDGPEWAEIDVESGAMTLTPASFGVFTLNITAVDIHAARYHREFEVFVE